MTVRTGMGTSLLLSALLFQSAYGALVPVDPTKFKVGELKWSNCTGEDVVPGAECGYAV